MLLALRGISRSDLVERSESAAEVGRASKPKEAVVAKKKQTRAQLKKRAEADVTPENFYGTPHTPLTEFGSMPPADIVAPLVQRLGPLPFWRGQERFADTLEQLYGRAVSRGLAVWSGEPLDLRRPEEKVVIKGASLHLKQHLRIERG
jgi:uncharacterized Zn finger protein